MDSIINTFPNPAKDSNIHKPSYILSLIQIFKGVFMGASQVKFNMQITWTLNFEKNPNSYSIAANLKILNTSTSDSKVYEKIVQLHF